MSLKREHKSPETPGSKAIYQHYFKADPTHQHVHICQACKLNEVDKSVKQDLSKGYTNILSHLNKHHAKLLINYCVDCFHQLLQYSFFHNIDIPLFYCNLLQYLWVSIYCCLGLAHCISVSRISNTCK